MGHPATEERRNATIRALRELTSEYGGQNPLAREAERRGIELSQKTISQVLTTEKVGADIADRVAAMYGLTIDALVMKFEGSGGESMVLRDVPGWASAKAAALDQHGHKFPDWVWQALDRVVVPVPLKRASVDMIAGLAGWLLIHGEVSHVKRSRRRRG